MSNPTKRWSQYQVDDSKTVADLTEAEAKTELCDAMDLIEKLIGLGERYHENVLDAARRAKYLP